MAKHPNWTKETSPKGKGRRVSKYCFTVGDIVNLTGKRIQTIRNDISKGKLNMSDLKSICQYISKPLSKEAQLRGLKKRLLTNKKEVDDGGQG